MFLNMLLKEPCANLGGESPCSYALHGLLRNSFWKWEEVHPLPDEWRQSLVLSVQALKRGLVFKRNEQAPKLTNDLLAEMLKLQCLTWEQIPQDLKKDVNFCQKLLDPEK